MPRRRGGSSGYGALVRAVAILTNRLRRPAIRRLTQFIAARLARALIPAGHLFESVARPAGTFVVCCVNHICDDGIGAERLPAMGRGGSHDLAHRRAFFICIPVVAARTIAHRRSVPIGADRNGGWAEFAAARSMLFILSLALRNAAFVGAPGVSPVAIALERAVLRR